MALVIFLQFFFLFDIYIFAIEKHLMDILYQFFSTGALIDDNKPKATYQTEKTTQPYNP